MNTIFTIILPDGEGDVRATLIARRGNHAHVDSFAYHTGNLMLAMQAAISELDLLERIPPQIEVSSTIPSKDKNLKAGKPKKKKVTLDDFPEDESDWGAVDNVERTVEVSAQANLSTVPPSVTMVAVRAGMTVMLDTGAVDLDGDPVSFQSGRVLEIDADASPPRVWVESSDGEQDVWMKLADL